MSQMGVEAPELSVFTLQPAEITLLALLVRKISASAGVSKTSEKKEMSEGHNSWGRTPEGSFELTLIN